MLRDNPALGGGDRIFPGQVLILSYRQTREGTLSVNGYAYPHIDRGLLQRTLPFLSDLTPFTYRFTNQGALIQLDDQYMIDAAQYMGVRPVFHLSNLDDTEGAFSQDLAHIALTDQQVQTRLIHEILGTLHSLGYQGLDVDFENVAAQDAQAYAQFISRLREALSPHNIPVLVALTAKTSRDQPGSLYEGHDYRLLAQAADYVLLMTYEWGYSYGPPMAIAPIRNVRQVIEYALTEMKAEQIFWVSPTTATIGCSPISRGGARPPFPIRRQSNWRSAITPPSAMIRRLSPPGSGMWMEVGRNTRSGSRMPGASRPSSPWLRNTVSMEWGIGT